MPAPHATSPWKSMVILLTAVLGCLGCGGDDAGPKGPPYRVDPGPYNVILISIDTLRADHLSCYGYGVETDPNLNAFAARSVVFKETRCQSPWTTPSHASLFTSLYPSVINIGRWPNPGKISPEAVTMAELLDRAGYQTAGFTEAGMISSKFGFDRGFNHFNERYQRIQQSVPECLDWIGQRRKEKFFAFLHTYDVHRYSPPGEFAHRLMPDYDGPVKPGQDLARSLQIFFDYQGYDDEGDRRKIISLYDEELLYVDNWLGVLFKGLEEMGLMERTIIILTSDHGEEFWEHGRTGHGYTNFEEVLRVPLIVYHPKIPPGSRASLVCLLDILPTVADMVGVAKRPDWQGQSLFPILKEEAAEGRGYSYAEQGHINYKSIQEGRWKLVRRMLSKKLTGRTSEDALYDLEKDHLETRNVSDEHPEVYKRLKKLLEQMITGNLKLNKNYRALEADINPELKEQLNGLGYGGGDK